MALVKPSGQDAMCLEISLLKILKGLKTVDTQMSTKERFRNQKKHFVEILPIHKRNALNQIINQNSKTNFIQLVSFPFP